MIREYLARWGILNLNNREDSCFTCSRYVSYNWKLLHVALSIENQIILYRLYPSFRYIRKESFGNKIINLVQHILYRKKQTF